MSRIYYEEISLNTLIGWSDLVVEVKRRDPFVVKEEIAIGDNADESPPFVKTIYNFEIRDILINKTGVEPESHLNVLPADVESSLELHRRYYLEGTSKSPIWSRYESSVDIESDKAFIVFLKTTEYGLEFTASGAAESLSKRKRILNVSRFLENGGDLEDPSLIDRIRIWAGSVF